MFGSFLARVSLRCLIAVASLAAVAGCARTAPRDEVDAGVDAGPPPDDAGPPRVTVADKVDLLFVVDNTRNMELAHQLLSQTFPYLMSRFSRPACVNGLGNVVSSTPGPADVCPIGEREFAAVTDVRVGVLSTSLGGHGGDVCSPASPSFVPTMNDAAHLLTRSADGTPVPTYQNQGFLAWDPGAGLSPPGDSDLPSFLAKFDLLMRGVGTAGCGFESQLESIYRFLVDPNPHLDVTVQGNAAMPVGTDALVLQQRADFLRPDSLVLVVLVSDEDDCSIRDGAQAFFISESLTPDGDPFRMPPARSECAANPADPCCASCGQATPPGCTETTLDPACQTGPLPEALDPLNLRCFDQKRRFGADFLQPVDRYVKGFTELTVADRDGNVVPNPLFGERRDPSMFVLAGVVGVPWQDISLFTNSLVGGFKPVSEIDWAAVIGDPSTGAPPSDPLMIPSVSPRVGTNPATGSPLAPPEATSPTANIINGHERIVAKGDDLQYACIYPRPVPKDCAAVEEDCECITGNFETNPVCQRADGGYGTVQFAHRAVPATRSLSVLRGLGEQGVAASICAPVTTNLSDPVFAYRPAVDALLRAARRHLR
jgi:hypothetical protein